MVDFYKHIVVVHGIGEEKLNETGINFMNESCRSPPADGTNYKLTVMNLVPRDTDNLVKSKSKPAYVIWEHFKRDSRFFIGFSEVYWQLVTKGYLAAHNGQPPVPIFTRGRSINNRVRGKDRYGQSLSLWRQAIDNVETLLNLARQLPQISKKADLISKEVDLFDRILRGFLGDVQMYAEVDDVHNKVNDVFRAALNDISEVRKEIPKRDSSVPTEIYIVAHSEGTVVSWKSLQLAAEQNPRPEWLKDVKGLVTLGSPIDSWATGLVVTALVWKLHTCVHKGLVQLWRYGQGSTKFSPEPEPAPPAGVQAARAH